MPRSPHSNSRPTLKLPAKPSVAEGEDETRTRWRKPVRGSSRTAKQSVAQRAGPVAATAPPPVTEQDKKPGERPRFKDDLPRKRAPITDAGPARDKASTAERPAARETRPEAPPKTYPKRGIARSTGARALPPARTGEERDAPAPNPGPAAGASPTPPRVRRSVTATDAAIPPRRPLNEPPRLSKRISEMAQCSRREADEWIENGWIRVDGVVVTTLGTRVHPNAKIEIRDEASTHETESVTVLFNKPLETASAQASDGREGRENAQQLIRADNRWAEDDTGVTFKATHLRGLALAGKLDPESSGMLVFTQEGSVARRITGDDTRLEKEYMVRVEGELTPDGLKLLNRGLSLDDVKLKPAQVSWQSEQQLRFVVHESRPRQIQRMCELIGLHVAGIKRIRIGSVSLGKLPAGQWRYLREHERF